MKHKLYALIVFTIATVLYSCTKEKIAPLPQISQFTPESGTPGTSVTITGSNFSTTSSLNKVAFVNGSVEVAAAILTASANEIVTTLPSQIQPGEYNIVVSVNGQRVSSSRKLTIESPDPVVNSFTPATADPGTVIEINGANFSTTPSANEVKFIVANAEPVVAVVEQANTTLLKVTVPASLAPGEYSISIKVAGKEASSAAKFTCTSPTAPRIGSIPTEDGRAGGKIRISGRNFSPKPSENVVEFVNDGGTPVRGLIMASTATSIEVIVPNGLAAGRYKIRITTGGQSVTSTETYTVIETPEYPAIAEVVINSSRTLVVTGKNFNKALTSTSITFIPEEGGNSLVRTPSMNKEGTELTYSIPLSFPKGRYFMLVSVGSESTYASKMLLVQ